MLILMLVAGDELALPTLDITKTTFTTVVSTRSTTKSTTDTVILRHRGRWTEFLPTLCSEEMSRCVRVFGWWELSMVGLVARVVRDTQAIAVTALRIARGS